MSIYVITDDLTGANDTAVQFSKKGLKTLVYLETMPSAIHGTEAEVLVFNTDSRAIPAESASQNIRKVVQNLPIANSDVIYKKIDSTLRGNIAVEVVETLKLSKREIAIVAPAYPKNHRTTLEGVHYVHGIPISESEAAKDPRCPVTCSYIPTLFQSQTSLPCALVPLDQIRTSPKELQATVSQLAGAGTKILVFDAETEDDLQTIVQGAYHSGYTLLWVGSAGLAEAVSAFYPKIKGEAPMIRSFSLVEPKPKPVLIILGSMSEIATQQGLTFCRWAGISPYILTIEDSLDPGTAIVDTAIDWIETNLTQRRHILVMSDRTKCISDSPTNTQDPISALLRTFQTLGSGIDFSLCAGLIVTGGDIATAVCKGMGASSIEVLTETSPGIPLGRVLGGPWEGFPLVTKAGAFGSPEAFILAAKRISTLSR